MRIGKERTNERIPAEGGDGPVAPGEVTDAFVSYCHADEVVVRELVAGLTGRGKQVWIDWEDIPPSVDWFDEIATGIDGADNFVCVISDDWISSRVCARELEHAVARSKRILPVLARPVDATRVAEVAAKINWIRCDRPGTLEAGVHALIEQMETDLPHVQGHTQWGKAAQEWERRERDPSYLLRGTELTSAEAWLNDTPDKQPPTTALQRELVMVSRQAATRRQRQLFAGVSVALVVAVVLSIVALVQRSSAIDQKHTAFARELGAQAQRNFDVDPELSVLLAAEGVRAKDGAASEDVLRTALVRSGVRARHDLGSPIVSLDISPNDKMYVASTFDERGYVYDMDTNKRLATFKTRTYGAPVVWDPDGRRVAVAGKDGVARVFDARTGRAVAQLKTGHVVAPTVAWSPNGKLLAVAADDTTGTGVDTRQTGGVAQVWNVASKRVVATLRGHVRGVNALAWTPDGRLLVTGGSDPSVRVWNAGSWTLRRTLSHAKDDYIGAIQAPAFASDLVVTSASIRKEIGDLRLTPADASRVGTRLWNVRTGRLVRAFKRSIGPAAINPGGAQLAYAPLGSAIEVYDIDDAQQLAPLVGHEGPVNALRYRGTGLISTSADGTARVWNPTAGGPPATLAGHAGPTSHAELDFFFNRRAVSGGEDGTVRSWSVGPELPGALHQGRGGGEGSTVLPALSPDGRFAVSQGDAHVIDIWNPATGKVLHRLPAPGAVYGALFTDDGARLVVLQDDKREHGEVAVWDARTWKRKALIAPSAGADTFDLSPAGRIVTIDADNSAAVWTLDGRRVAEVRPRHGTLNAAALSDDATRLLTASEDKVAQLWSVPGGRRLHDLRGHGEPKNPFEREPKAELAAREHAFGVLSADFDAGGEHVATGGADGTARVWNVRTGKLERVMRGHTQNVSTVEFSPEGSRLLTGSPDGTARVWRVDSGAQIRRVEHLEPARRFLSDTNASWSSDGKYFLTDGAGSSNVELWRAYSGLRVVQALGEFAAVRRGGHELITAFQTLSEVYHCASCVDGKDLLRAARARTTRPLSQEEQIRYLHREP
jgi:WD40 repeat protein